MLNSKLIKLLAVAGVVGTLTACGNQPQGPNLTTQAFDPYGGDVRPLIAQWNDTTNLQDPTRDNSWFGIRLAAINAETYTATGRLANFSARTYVTTQEAREALAQACRTTGDKFVMDTAPNGQPRGQYEGHRVGDNKDVLCYYERQPAGMVHIIILTSASASPAATSNARPADYKN